MTLLPESLSRDHICPPACICDQFAQGKLGCLVTLIHWMTLLPESLSRDHICPPACICDKASPSPAGDRCHLFLPIKDATSEMHPSHSGIINSPFVTGPFLSAYECHMYCDFPRQKKKKKTLFTSHSFLASSPILHSPSLENSGGLSVPAVSFSSSPFFK